MDLDSVKSRINGILRELKEFYESDTNRYYQDDVKLDIIMIETYLEECNPASLHRHNNDYYKEFIGDKNVLFCDAWSYLKRLKLKIDKPKKLSEIARNTIKKIMKGKNKDNEAYEKLMGSIVSGTTKEKELRINEELNRIVPVTETILIHLKSIFKKITWADIGGHHSGDVIPNTILPNADLVYDGDKMSLIPNFDGDNESLNEDFFVTDFYEKKLNNMLQYVIFDNNSILSNLGHRECSLKFMVREIERYKWSWEEFIMMKNMEVDGGAKSGEKKHNKTKSKKNRNNKKTRKNKNKKRSTKKHYKNPK